MTVAIGVGVSLFLSMLSLLDGIGGFITGLLWLFSLFSKKEGLSWYWFYKSLWIFLFGIIIGILMVASIAYTATTTVSIIASNVQIQQVNKHQEQQQVVKT